MKDDRGMLATDWVAVTARALLFGLVAVYAVATYSIGDPAASLLDQFADVDQQIAAETTWGPGSRQAISFTK